MKTQKTPLSLSECIALISSLLLNKDHPHHILCNEFMRDANSAYLMLVEYGSVDGIVRHGVYDSFHRFRERLGGMKSAVCYMLYLPEMLPIYEAFTVVIDILYEVFEDSAVVATTPPDSAVLENAVVETVQGATYPLCDFCIEQGHENVLIDAQASPPLYSQCAQCAHYPAHLKHGWLYHLGDCTPEEYAEECLRLERLQGVPVQLTDSFFDPLPLSVYSAEDFSSEVVL